MRLVIEGHNCEATDSEQNTGCILSDARWSSNLTSQCPPNVLSSSYHGFECVALPFHTVSLQPSRPYARCKCNRKAIERRSFVRSARRRRTLTFQTTLRHMWATARAVCSGPATAYQRCTHPQELSPSPPLGTWLCCTEISTLTEAVALIKIHQISRHSICVGANKERV